MMEEQGWSQVHRGRGLNPGLQPGIQLIFLNLEIHQGVTPSYLYHEAPTNFVSWIVSTLEFLLGNECWPLFYHLVDVTLWRNSFSLLVFTFYSMLSLSHVLKHILLSCFSSRSIIGFAFTFTYLMQLKLLLMNTEW